MAQDDERGGRVEPYGPPMWDAINRGDLHEMQAVAAAARKALYGVEFAPVGEHNREDVVAALDELERKIAQLKRPS